HASRPARSAAVARGASTDGMMVHIRTTPRSRRIAMPIKLGDMLNPSTTAVLCMEMQRGVVGDLCTMPQLADAVNAAGVKQNLASLLDAARSSGVQVVFCNALHRKDRKGSG